MRRAAAAPAAPVAPATHTAAIAATTAVDPPKWTTPTQTQTFFRSSAFRDLYDRARTQRLGVLVVKAHADHAKDDDDMTSSTSATRAVSTAGYDALLPDTPEHLLGHVVPASDDDDRARLLRTWSNRLVRVAPLPSTLSEASKHSRMSEELRWVLLHETHSSTTLQEHTSSPDALAQPWRQQRTLVGKAQTFLVTFVRGVRRDVTHAPLKWLLAGGATWFQSPHTQKMLTQAFARSVFPYLEHTTTDIDELQRNATNLGNVLAQQFGYLPNTVFRIAGDKSLRTGQMLGRVAMQVTTPVVVNMLLLTPLPTLAAMVGVSALAVGLLALEARKPTASTDVLGRGATTFALTTATALTTRLALAAVVPGGTALFEAGTLQFYVASSLTSNVANGTVTRVTNGYLSECNAAPVLLDTLLQETQRDFTLLRYRAYVRKTARAAAGRASRLFAKLPAPMDKYTPAFVAGFTQTFGLWLCFVSLPYHVDQLQYHLHQYKPLQEGLVPLRAAFGLLGQSEAFEWAYRTGQTLTVTTCYQQLWYPLLNAIVRDHLRVDQWVTAKVTSSLDALQARFPWVKQVLTDRPFKRILSHELAQRWRLQFLLDASIEHLFLRSPLAVVLNVVTDVRMGAPTAVAKYLVDHAADPVVRAMQATYDSRMDVFAVVQHAFLRAPPADHPTPSPQSPLGVPSALAKPVVVHPTQQEALSALADGFLAVRDHPAETAATHLRETYSAYQATLQGSVPDTTDANVRNEAAQYAADYAALTTTALDDARRASATVQEHARHNEPSPNDQAAQALASAETTLRTYQQRVSKLRKTLNDRIREHERLTQTTRRHVVQRMQRDTDRATKRRYLREIQDQSRVLRFALFGKDNDNAPAEATPYIDVDNATLYTYLSVAELRRFRNGYVKLKHDLQAWYAVTNNVTNDAPPTADLQRMLDRTNVVAQMLAFPVHDDEARKQPWLASARFVHNVNSFDENVQQFRGMVDATGVLVHDHRRKAQIRTAYDDLTHGAHAKKHAPVPAPNGADDVDDNANDRNNNKDPLPTYAQMKALAYVYEYELTSGERARLTTRLTDPKTDPRTLPSTFQQLREELPAHVRGVLDRVARNQQSKWTRKRKPAYDKAVREFDRLLHAREAGMRKHFAAFETYVRHELPQAQQTLDDLRARLLVGVPHPPPSYRATDLTTWLRANPDVFDAATVQAYQHALHVVEHTPHVFAQASKVRAMAVLDNSADVVKLVDDTVDTYNERQRTLHKALDALQKQQRDAVVRDLHHKVQALRVQTVGTRKTRLRGGIWSARHAKYTPALFKAYQEQRDRLREVLLSVAPLQNAHAPAPDAPSAAPTTSTTSATTTTGFTPSTLLTTQVGDWVKLWDAYAADLSIADKAALPVSEVDTLRDTLHDLGGLDEHLRTGLYTSVRNSLDEALAPTERGAMLSRNAPTMRTAADKRHHNAPTFATPSTSWLSSAPTHHDPQAFVESVHKQLDAIDERAHDHPDYHTVLAPVLANVRTLTTVRVRMHSRFQHVLQQMSRLDALSAAEQHALRQEVHQLSETMATVLDDDKLSLHDVDTPQAQQPPFRPDIDLLRTMRDEFRSESTFIERLNPFHKQNGLQQRLRAFDTLLGLHTRADTLLHAQTQTNTFNARTLHAFLKDSAQAARAHADERPMVAALTDKRNTLIANDNAQHTLHEFRQSLTVYRKGIDTPPSSGWFASSSTPPDARALYKTYRALQQHFTYTTSLERTLLRTTTLTPQQQRERDDLVHTLQNLRARHRDALDKMQPALLNEWVRTATTQATTETPAHDLLRQTFQSRTYLHQLVTHSPTASNIRNVILSNPYTRPSQTTTDNALEQLPAYQRARKRADDHIQSVTTEQVRQQQVDVHEGKLRQHVTTVTERIDALRAIATTSSSDTAAFDRTTGDTVQAQLQAAQTEMDAARTKLDHALQQVTDTTFQDQRRTAFHQKGRDGGWLTTSQEAGVYTQADRASKDAKDALDKWVARVQTEDENAASDATIRTTFDQLDRRVTAFTKLVKSGQMSRDELVRDGKRIDTERAKLLALIDKHHARARWAPELHGTSQWSLWGKVGLLQKLDEAKQQVAQQVARLDEAARVAKAEADAAEAERLAAEAKRVAEAKQKADDAEAKRLAAEAKQKADDAEAKRLAAEAERLAAEAKRVAEAKQKAEAKRLAAEAKQKADDAEAKRLAAEAKQKAEAKRLAAKAKAKAEAEAKAKAKAKAKAEAEAEAEAKAKRVQAHTHFIATVDPYTPAKNDISTTGIQEWRNAVVKAYHKAVGTRPNENPQWDDALQKAIDTKLYEYANALHTDIEASFNAVDTDNPTNAQLFALWENYQNTHGRKLRVVKEYYDRKSTPYTNPKVDKLYDTFTKNIDGKYKPALRNVIQHKALDELNALKQERDAIHAVLQPSSYTWMPEAQKQAVHARIDEYSRNTNAFRKAWGALFERSSHVQTDVPAFLKSIGFHASSHLLDSGWTFVEGGGWRDVSNGASNTHGKGDLERAPRPDPELLKAGNAPLKRLHLLKNVGEYEQDLAQSDATDIKILQEQVQEVLFVGKTGCMTTDEFKDRFDVQKPAYGFQPEFYALQRLHATRLAHTVQHSKAMREVLGVRTQQGNALIEALMQVDTAKFEKLNDELAQSRKAVEAAGGEYAKSYDKRMYNALETYNIAIRKAWDITALFSGKVKLDGLDTKPIPELKKGENEKDALQPYADFNKLRNIEYDDDLRWVYLSLLRNKHEAKGQLADDAMLQLAVNKPHLFQKNAFTKNVLTRMDSLEMSFYEMKPQFDWQAVMFDLWKAHGKEDIASVLHKTEWKTLFFEIPEKTDFKKIFSEVQKVPSVIYGYKHFWHDKRSALNRKHFGYSSWNNAYHENKFIDNVDANRFLRKL